MKNTESKYTFNQEVRELDINMSLYEVVAGLGVHNALDGIKLLKLKWGVSYEKVAKVMGIASSTLRLAIKNDTFDCTVGENRLVDGIENIQLHYIGDSFMEGR